MKIKLYAFLSLKIKYNGNQNAAYFQTTPKYGKMFFTVGKDEF